MAKAKQTKYVPIDQFGKDHWSTFAYVETLCVDSQTGDGWGHINADRMRTNSKRHPFGGERRALSAEARTWGPEHGTRLRGFWKADRKEDPSRQLQSHDDWDCLEDLEAAGLIFVRSLANGFVRMTELGNTVAAALRKHKTEGGSFADFVWEQPCSPAQPTSS